MKAWDYMIPDTWPLEFRIKYVCGSKEEFKDFKLLFFSKPQIHNSTFTQMDRN